MHNMQKSGVLKRPRLRSECINAPRPCPWVSCKHHFAYTMGPKWWDLSDEKIVEWVFTKMIDTCTLDVADRGGVSLQYIADRTDVTKERIRQLSHAETYTRGGGSAIGKIKKYKKNCLPSEFL